MFVFADHFVVYDLSPAVGCDILVTDDIGGLSAFESLFRVGGMISNALIETSKFVSVGRVPYVLIFRIATENMVCE